MEDLMNRKYLGVLGALAAGALVASAVLVPAASAAPVLTIWTTTNAQETPTLQSIAADYERQNPGVKVKIVMTPFDTRDAKFSAAVQAKKGPDIMRAEIADVALWASKGYLADITKFVSAADKKDFLPGAFAYYNYLGKIWGLPHAPDAPALLYNKKMFKDAGMTVPKTLAELQSSCEAKFPTGNGIFLRGDSYWVQAWVWGFGGGLVNPATKSILIGSAKSAAGLQAYKDLMNSKCAMPNTDFANDYGNAQAAFKAGQVAMIINGPWASSDILAGAAFADKSNLGVAAIPKGPGGQGSPVGGNGWVISKTSKNYAASVKLLTFLAGAAANEKWASANNLLPSRASAYKLPLVANNPVITQFLAQMKVATARPVLPQGGQIYTDFGPNFQNFLQGKTTAQGAATIVAKAWQSKLFKDYKITS